MIRYNTDGATLYVYDTRGYDEFRIDATSYIYGSDYENLIGLMGGELAAVFRDCWNSTGTFPEDLERAGRVLEGTRYAAYVEGVTIEVM